MNDPEFDVIVVGAGSAGICAAGELVCQGLRPLLICETKEVAYNLRPVWINGNRVVIQAATFSPTSTGGWWFPLARRLGADIGPMTYQMPGTVALWGSTELRHLHTWYLSAAAAADAIEAISPIPLGDCKPEVLRVLRTAFAIPYDQLCEMDTVPWSQWLSEQTGDEFVTMLFNFMACLFTFCSMEMAEHLTVFSALAGLRAVLLAEAHFPEAVPDLREGVFIPLAQAAERNGATVWRGRKVDHVVTEGGVVRGVVMEDGTEASAPVVAIAAGNPRIPSLFDSLPPELAPIANTEVGEQDHNGYYSITLLDGEVLPSTFKDWFLGVNVGSWVYVAWPVHVRTPWGVEPGKHVLASAMWFHNKQVREMGGRDAVYDLIHEVDDFYFPGHQKAIEEQKTFERGGMWYSQIFGGLERKSPSVEGLWYVNDGSRPIKGLFTEAAASAGILGARAIAEEHQTSRRR